MAICAKIAFMVEKLRGQKVVDAVKAKYGGIPTGIFYGDLISLMGRTESVSTLQIDEEILQAGEALAIASKRKRSLIMLHKDLSEQTHRFINTMITGTYARPHKHINPATIETFSALKGAACVIEFSDDGEIKKLLPFGVGKKASVIEINPGVFHTVLPLTKIFSGFEIKGQTNFTLETDKFFPDWAPVEGKAAEGYLIQLYGKLQVLAGKVDGVRLFG